MKERIKLWFAKQKAAIGLWFTNVGLKITDLFDTPLFTGFMTLLIALFCLGAPGYGAFLAFVYFALWVFLADKRSFDKRL